MTAMTGMVKKGVKMLTIKRTQFECTKWQKTLHRDEYRSKKCVHLGDLELGEPDDERPFVAGRPALNLSQCYFPVAQWHFRRRRVRLISAPAVRLSKQISASRKCDAARNEDGKLVAGAVCCDKTCVDGSGHGRLGRQTLRMCVQYLHLVEKPLLDLRYECVCSGLMNGQTSTCMSAIDISTQEIEKTVSQTIVEISLQWASRGDSLLISEESAQRTSRSPRGLSKDGRAASVGGTAIGAQVCCRRDEGRRRTRRC